MKRQCEFDEWLQALSECPIVGIVVAGGVVLPLDHPRAIERLQGLEADDNEAGGEPATKID
jgi:hypothetical protein